MEAAASPRAWQLVLARIEADLRDGRISAGDRLAPERELATQLGVGRSSVREALRVLEVLGVIRTSTGSGPTSGAIIIATPRGGLSTLLRLQVAASGFPVDDVVRTRTLIETASVDTLAAAPDRDTSTAHELLDAMDAPDLTTEEFLALDARLHLSLVEAAGNIVVSAMMEGLRDAIESYVSGLADTFPDWDAAAAGLRAEHRAIIAAVDAGEGPTAHRLVSEHIARYYAGARRAGSGSPEPAPAPAHESESAPAEEAAPW